MSRAHFLETHRRTHDAAARALVFSSPLSRASLEGKPRQKREEAAGEERKREKGRRDGRSCLAAGLFDCPPPRPVQPHARCRTAFIPIDHRGSIESISFALLLQRGCCLWRQAAASSSSSCFRSSSSRQVFSGEHTPHTHARARPRLRGRAMDSIDRSIERGSPLIESTIRPACGVDGGRCPIIIQAQKTDANEPGLSSRCVEGI
jgi:hypothetical protein